MGSIVAMKDLLVDFSNILKDYQFAQINNKPCHNDKFIQKFRKLSSTEANKTVLTPEISENWDLEAKLWHLIDLLCNFRSSYKDGEMLQDDTTIYRYNSDIVYKKSMLQNNKQLYEIWLIMVWIQQNLPAPVRPATLSGTKWINSSTSGGMASCDVDYPLRAEAALDEKDVEADSIAFKYIYELILCGKFDEAKSECELTENLSLGMILCGFDDFCDPLLDTQIETTNNTTSPTGTERKALWRRAIFALSENPALNKYEKAIYKYLSGSIPSKSLADEITVENWDTYMLLYLNQLWTISIEEYLKSLNRIPADELVLDIPESLTNIQSILNTVSSACPSQSEHPIRVLMAAVIMNNVSSVIKSSVNMLMESFTNIKEEGLFEKEPFLLRLLTHVVIVCDIVEPGTFDKEDKYSLISSYVKILSMYGLYETIPVYVSFLEEEQLLLTYSSILSSIFDQTIKAEQLSMCTSFQLPTSNILRKLAESVFESTTKYYNSEIGYETSIDLSIDIHDTKLVNSIDWLINGHLYSEAMNMIIAVCRRFLTCGKTEALSKLLTDININDLITHYRVINMDEKDESGYSYELKIKELLQYGQLVEGLTLYKNWNGSSSLLNNQSNLPSLVDQFREFSTHFQDLIKSFLSDLVEDNDTLYQIRALYVPYLVIELHKSLMGAFEALQITAFAYEALSLSSVVADEGNKIYLLFQSSGKLKEFLRLVASSSIKVGVRK